ncbi:MAG: helix-turn-helix transcriptional regulator [Armatimonadota bacterium]|nr:helix-turn-helix transcriptional regulator [Armatimonadota bacterium]
MRAQEETRFALALAEMREARGLTQWELAEKTGIKQPMLARIERRQVLTLPTLRRLAHALNGRVIITPTDGIIVEAVGAAH